MTILILIGVVLLTSGIAFLFSDKIKSKHRLFSTFSAALVASLIFVHILPDIYVSSNAKWLGVTLLGGLILQLILEKVTHGVGHGHDHTHARNHKSILIGVMLGLGVHAMIEGMPILMNDPAEMTEGHDHHHHHEHLSEGEEMLSVKFLSAVLMHKVPVTIMLSLFLLSIGVRPVSYFLLIGVFAAMTPLGALLGRELMGHPNFGQFTTYLVAVSTGMLLHIITSILFEHGHSRKENNLHILLIIAGIVIGVLLF